MALELETFEHCCGAGKLFGFPYFHSCYGKTQADRNREIKARQDTVVRFLDRYWRYGVVFAILNQGQEKYLGSILLKAGFKQISCVKNPINGNNLIFSYILETGNEADDEEELADEDGEDGGW